MQMRDQMDTLPCDTLHNRYITFIFSQQPYASPSFLSYLLQRHSSKRDEIIPVQAFRMYDKQWHKVIYKITKGVLPHDVELDEAGDYLNKMDLNEFISNSLLLSPESINRLLAATTKNFLKATGRARAVKAGILFTRKLHKGEKFHVCIFSLTPATPDEITRVLRIR